MDTAPFIITENRYGRGPEAFFAWTPDIQQAASGIQSGAIRRMVLDRLVNTDGQVVRHAAQTLLGLHQRLDLWADFVKAAPVNTSFGTISSADLPSILSAIAIIDPIVAAIRGERIETREVA